MRKEKIILLLFLMASFQMSFGQDTPCTAGTITPVSSSCSTSITRTTIDLTGANASLTPPSGCSDDGTEDVFYKFTPLAGITDYKFVANWTGLEDYALNIYEEGTDCNDLNEATGLTVTLNRAFLDTDPSNCVKLRSGSARYSPLRIEGIDPTKTYYLRISENSNLGGSMEAYLAPHNPEDWCATAQPLTTSGCNYGAQETNEPDNTNWVGAAHSGTFNGDPIQTCSGWGTIENMVWYTFEVTAVTPQPITIEVSNVTCEGGTAGTPELQLGVFTKTVPCSGSSTEGLADETGLGCAAGTGTLSILLPTLPVGEYYVVADGDEGSECIWDFSSTQVLPVEFAGMDGYVDGKVNQIEWETASELNNSHFEIQRAANITQKFTSIGRVEGNGTTAEYSRYYFTDEEPLAQGYYRLKQVDFDGTIDYSKVISIKRDNGKGINIINLFPNPARGNSISFEFNSRSNEDMVVSIHNTLGQVVMIEKIESMKGFNSNVLDITNIPRGIHTLSISNGMETTITKFVKY